MKKTMTLICAAVLATSALFAQERSISALRSTELRSSDATKGSLCAGALEAISCPSSFLQNGLRAAAGVCAFGYDNPSTEPQAIGLGGKGKPGTYLLAAVELPGKYFAGGKIVGVDFFIAKECKTTKPTRIFVLEKGSKKELVGTDGKTPTVDQFNSVDFGSPVPIDPAKTYIVGYCVENLEKDYPIGFDGAESAPCTEANLVMITEPTPKPAEYEFDDLSGNGFGNLRIHVRVSGGETYSQAANIVAASIPARVEAGKPFSFPMTIVNRGFEKIASIDVEVKYADKVVTKNFSNLDIPSMKSGVVKIENISIEAVGKVNVSVSLKKINSKDNLLASQTITCGIKTQSPGSMSPLTSVLLERFTGESCGNCPKYKSVEDQFMQEMNKKGLQVNRIEHHAGYGKDFLTMPESEALIPLYGGGSYAPAVMLNRTVSSKSKTPVFIQPKDFEGFLQATIDNGSLISIDHVTQKLEGDKYICTVTGSVLPAYAKNEYHISIVLTESDILAQRQAGASAGYKHHDVARLFMCGQGEKITIQDNKFTFTKEGAIKDAWKKENMKCVVFVGEPFNSKDIKNCNIYASRTAFFNTPESVNNVSAEDVDVRVIDGNILVYGNNYGINVYDITGQRVSDEHLPAGVYLVRVQVGVDNYIVRKVIVR